MLPKMIQHNQEMSVETIIGTFSACWLNSSLDIGLYSLEVGAGKDKRCTLSDTEAVESAGLVGPLSYP